jgi:hypothetical protein
MKGRVDGVVVLVIESGNEGAVPSILILYNENNSHWSIASLLFRLRRPKWKV